MFASYKKHSNKLYNKLVELSRNKFFYNELKLNDNFETRVLLIFFHFIIILRLKKNEKYKKIFQESFDNIFQNNLSIKNYNFINIDIQGYELEALKGMPNQLKIAEYIYLEVNFEEVYLGCSQIKDIDKFLLKFD